LGRREVRSRERPEGASGSTEVAARAASEASEQTVFRRLRCGAGLKGAAARRAQATQALEGASNASD
ncbi:hypothetical protein, partial [Halorubrum sp. SP9]|uniref:hypothetical protein n=1 Tax=Halorubrum sp. SP9 TaxID=1537267 RepID=UPI001A7E05A4